MMHSLKETFEEKLQQRDTFIKTLEQALALAKQRHYGRGSEKNLSDATQGSLFDEVIVPTNTAETITVPAHQRKKLGRKPVHGEFLIQYTKHGEVA